MNNNPDVLLKSVVSYAISQAMMNKIVRGYYSFEEIPKMSDMPLDTEELTGARLEMHCAIKKALEGDLE